MAGRKLPALPSLADFPAQGDKLYGVDVSDTSESPQGTSKQFEFSEILNTGTYTPTFSAETDCTVTAAGSQPWRWVRVGEQVIVTGVGVMQLDALAESGTFLFDLPVVPANDWSNSFQALCNANIQSISGGDLSDSIGFAFTSDRDTPSKNILGFIGVAPAAAGSSATFSFTLMYTPNN